MRKRISVHRTWRRTLAFGFVVALLVAMQSSPATADPGGPGSAGGPPEVGRAGLEAHHPIAIHFKDPASCWGFSYGGSSNPSIAYGSSYNSCSGDVLDMQTDIHLIWCVQVTFGTCNPWQDLGSMTNGQRFVVGQQTFWTPETGNATMGNLASGYSYMVRTTLYVTLTDGSSGTGWSSSSIFQTPMP